MGKALQPGLRFAPARVQIERRADGAMILRSPLKLGGHARAVGVWLERWAREKPGRTFLAERRDGAWRKLGYREALGLAAAGDPLGQLRRPRASRARRDACRRSGRARLARLFADVEGFRQAQSDLRAAASGPGVDRRSREVRACARRG